MLVIFRVCKSSVITAQGVTKNKFNKLIGSNSLLIIGLSLLGFSSLALAQTSAGEILQQIQRSQPGMTLPQVAPSIERAKPIDTKSDQLQFVVKKFVFLGNTKVSTTELEKLVRGYLNRPITFADLQAATDQISEHYRNQDFLVRAVLPKQDISNGTVMIQIIEATFGSVIITNKSTRVSNTRAQDWIYGQLPQDSLISLNKIDRALLMLNDLPDIDVSGSLQAGQKEGQTDVNLTVVDQALFSGNVGVDNYGITSTGQNRTTASLNINGPLGLGEQVSIFGLYTEGSSYGAATLTAPVGNDGLRVGVNGSYLSYRVIDKSFSQLGSNGSSSTGSALMSYPLIRSRAANLYFSGNYSINSFDNYYLNNVFSKYNTQFGQANLMGNLIDSLAGGGLNFLSMTLTSGKVNLNTSPSLGNDLIGPQVAGNFTTFRYNLNRLQTITNGLAAYLEFSGQMASKNLDPSEQFYLGGPLNVRAYAAGQGSATQGTLTTAELRHKLPYQLELAGFYDYGTVQTWKNNYFQSAATDNDYVMQGFGASLVWRGPYNLQIRGTWAQRTGNLPNGVSQVMSASSAGLSTNRYWLSASVPL